MSLGLPNEEQPLDSSLAVSAEAPQAVPSAPLAPLKAPEQRFDFRHPVFLSSGEWRKIRMEVEDFAESVGALLATYLRLEFNLQVAKVETLVFTELVAAMPASTHLTLFKTEPLRGVSVIEIRPEIGLGIVDRLLGGPGVPANLDRNLTEMEVALMDQVVQLLLAEWCKQWKRFQELRAEISGHENNPRFLQNATADTILLVLALEARMGESTGHIQIAVPYNSFEPILTKVAAKPPAAPAPARPLKWNRQLDSIPIQLDATWPAFKLPARQLFELKVGEILPLQPQAAERIELRVGKATKFRGTLGLRQDKLAVQITELSNL